MASCEKVEKFKASRLKETIALAEKEKFLKVQQDSSDGQSFDEDTRCGFGYFRGKWLQKLASKKSFLVIHAVTGMIYNASFYYYSGTLTTLEKHYKFTSAQVGYIGAVYDIVATIVSLIAPYYCSKGRFPTWMGFAILCYGISNIIYISPYLIYGAGSDALALTEEFGPTFNPNSTQELIHQMKMKELCYANSKSR
jgi:Organic Anion Transporter Polypeptide (OATP) family